MDQKIKKNIRIIAEKNNCTILYNSNSLTIIDSMNSIQIAQNNKYEFDLVYNIIKDIIQIKVPIEEIYDVLLELLRRIDLNKIKLKTGVLIQLIDWIKEEGVSAKDNLEKLKMDLKIKSIEYRHLGGNRIEAEYYKGLLILSDDLCWNKSNIIEIKVQ
ncbi:hypothetical protein [uncultured Aquimarina sp.]|uniref:hypothetical protein n=1 Tax=uncultured Aquimarina sp. TaxID=575652 RepID=UPI00261C04AB|nr:hypothetical protein [uncultured Aquimarina sp.]